MRLSSAFSRHIFSPLTSKVANQVEALVPGRHDLAEGVAVGARLGKLGLLVLVAETREALLEGDAERDDEVARGVGVDPLLDLDEILVLLPDVVALAQVDQVDDGLGAEELEAVALGR